MPHQKESALYAVFDTVDIFSEPSRIFFKGKRILSTTFGGLLSMALVIFVLYQISTEFDNMLNYQDPNLYQINELEDDPGSISLGPKTNFVFAAYLLLDGVTINFTTASPFNFPTTYNTYYNFANGTKKRLKYPVIWTPCLEKDFPAALYGDSVFTKKSLNYAYCITGVNYTDSTDGSCPDDIVEMYPDCVTPANFELNSFPVARSRDGMVKGDYNAEEFRFIQGKVIACDPSDSTKPADMTCMTDDLATIFTKQVYNFDILYTYSLINMNNYEEPNKTVLDNYYWAFNPKISKVSNIYYDTVTVEDFDDFVSSTDKNRTYYSASPNKIRDLETFTLTDTDTYLQFNIRRSSLNLVVTRTYMKITDILTDLGGLAKAMMFACAFLAIGYVRYKYLVMVANELYDYKFPEEEEKERKKQLREKLLLKKKTTSNKGELQSFMSMSIDQSVKKNLVNENQSFTSPRGDDNANKAIVEYAEKLEWKKERLRHNEVAYFTEVMSTVCCCVKKNSKRRFALSQRARDKVLYDLDVVKIIRKIEQFDKLQSVILNVYQREALQFIEKPIVTLHSKKPLHLDSLTRSILTAHRRESQMLSPPERKKLSIFSAMAGGAVGNKADRDNDMSRAEPSTTLTNFFKVEDQTGKNDYTSLQKFGRLYVSYRHLQEDEDPSNELYNKKLVGMLDPALMKVFRRIDQLLERDASPEQFEDVVKQILATTKDE